MRRVLSVLAVLCAIGAACARAEPVAVGSKAFTESVVLGEIAVGLLRSSGIEAHHRSGLGGTQVLWQALLGGEIDAYPEYTGTIRREIFAGHRLGNEAALRAALAAKGVRMTAPLGFDNTYALGVTRETAARLDLKSISDLAAHPGLRLGFSNEFMDRADGWPALRRAYGLDSRNVRGMDHDLAYRALAAGEIDVTDVYTTDAEIAYYDLVLMKDDRGHFPAYEAVMLYRADLGARAAEALRRIEGRIDAATMSAMNARVKIGDESAASVAADFLQRALGIETDPREAGLVARLLATTADHLLLVAISLSAAIAVAIPLGMVAARRPRLGQAVLGATGVVQTIPALALLVFMIPLLGIGGPPAIAALFLYSLLPIVRNTHAGLVGIAPSLRESARALGLPDGAQLRLVDLPLAAPAILAGIKTSAVINVGTATLGALIGAGGYGQPILTGIRLNDIGLILEGAVPAAALALAAQGAFEAAERLVVPKGLRLGVPTASS